MVRMMFASPLKKFRVYLIVFSKPGTLLEGVPDIGQKAAFRPYGRTCDFADFGEAQEKSQNGQNDVRQSSEEV